MRPDVISVRQGDPSRVVFTLGAMPESELADLRKEMVDVRGGLLFDTTRPDEMEELDQQVLSVAASRPDPTSRGWFAPSS